MVLVRVPVFLIVVLLHYTARLVDGLAPLLLLRGRNSCRSFNDRPAAAVVTSINEKDNDDHWLTSSNCSNWSVTDDWEQLSQQENAGPDSGDLFNQDVVFWAAQRMGRRRRQQQQQQPAPDENGEETLLRQMIDYIQHKVLVNADGEDDEEDRDMGGGLDERDREKEVTAMRRSRSADDDGDWVGYNQDIFLDAMGTEIARLVQCNQRSESILSVLAPTSEGRSSPTESSEFLDLGQLMQQSSQDGQVVWEPTLFFQQAMDSMFHRHAAHQQQQQKKTSPTTSSAGGKTRGQFEAVLTADGVASWMSQCLAHNVGPYDRRVVAIISKFGTYGIGCLTRHGFGRLYVDAMLGGEEQQNDGSVSLQHLQAQRRDAIEVVWRDLSRHGIKSPAQIEQGRLRRATRLNQSRRLASGASRQHSDPGLFVMEECELMDDDEASGGHDSSIYNGQRGLAPSTTMDRNGHSSHERVELASDGQTPVWIRDGDFVFVDEESCIGCTQCASAAPASFQMVSSGRARTFCQRTSPDVAHAISACPVDCIHRVSFRELKQLETARDYGDGRGDHRHFGYNADRGYMGRTPLHVSGIQSDHSGRSSWYHHLRTECYKSPQCPERGCYNCPMYQANPESNPYFAARLKDSYRIRAQHFMDNGMADSYRKTVDL